MKNALPEEGDRHPKGTDLASYYESVLAPENADVEEAMAGMGAYVEDPSSGRKSDIWYATAGTQGMGSYYETGQSMGMYYENPAKYPGMEGLGAGAEWTPGPNEAPSDDPRIARKYAKVTSVYSPRNISGDQTTKVAEMLVVEAKRRFPKHRVRKIGQTGWTSSSHPAGSGKVGFEIILSEPMRAGAIKKRFFEIGQKVGPEVGPQTSLYDARTIFNPSDLSMPKPEEQAKVELKEQEEDLTKPPPEPPKTQKDENGNFLTQEVAGLPVWLIGVLGVGAVGGVAYLTLRGRGKGAAGGVTPNRRKRRRRRRTRRRR